MTVARAPRWLVVFCAAGLVLFVLLVGAAIDAYPGGTWFDPLSRGYSFWKNFHCDLFHHRALNGRDNARSATLAIAGTTAMFAALAAFFALVARLDGRSPESRLAKVTRFAGVTSCVVGMAVPLTPSDVNRVAHLTAVTAAFVPALIAVMAAAWISVRSKSSALLALFAIATLAFGASDGVAYAIAFSIDTRNQLLEASLPLFQRLAMLSLIGWMLSVLAAHARRT
ncbi:MAG: hypothetical protein JNK05_33035 [Myxococcales bacterium]|nr:hypothetical protein [Myxococcales bacterium]